jgi:hypothetical protein
VGRWITEVHQQPIAEILRDMSCKAANHPSADLSIGVYHLAEFFGIELLGQGGRAYQITEHHRQLPAFAGIPSRV